MRGARGIALDVFRKMHITRTVLSLKPTFTMQNPRVIRGPSTIHRAPAGGLNAIHVRLPYLKMPAGRAGS